MTQNSHFDLKDFLPYLLNQAAEQSSLEFQRYYKDRYGMLRTEWRVLFHLGRYGEMTAKSICERAKIHKTKVSRAVGALEAKRFLTRKQMSQDRRHETLGLTKTGWSAFEDLNAEAQRFDREKMAAFSEDEKRVLRRCLIKIAQL